MRSIRIPCASVVLVLLGSFLLPPGAWGSVGPWRSVGVRESVKEDKPCVNCHGASGMILEMENGEEISLFIDESVYSSSPHSALGCRSCHGELALETHPGEKRFASRNEYAALRNEICKNCHGRPAKPETPLHKRLIARVGAPRCTSCHVPHKMMPVRMWKGEVGTSSYCLTCHKEKLKTSLDGKKTFEITIMEAAQGKEVDMNHNCIDCHPGYSKQAHPLWGTGTRQKQVQNIAAICRKCHSGQYQLVQGTMHYQLRKKINPSAPVCIDCHGYHAVESKVDFEWLSGNSCRRCHEDVFTAYADSGHGQKRATGHLEAPACPDCHRSHEVNLASLDKPLMEACLGCHQNTHNKHRKWLPNVFAHFEALACTACHSPVTSDKLVVTIYDTGIKKNLSNKEVTKRVGAKNINQKPNDPAIQQDLAYWSELTRLLNRKAATNPVRYLLRLKVASGIKTHALGGTQESRKNCDSCHQGKVQYLD